MRKDSLTTSKFDQFFHPTNAADQRVHPLLEEYSRTARELPRGFRNSRQLIPQSDDEREPAGFRGNQSRDVKDGLEHVLHGLLVEYQNAHARFDQIVGDLRLKL